MDKLIIRIYTFFFAIACFFIVVYAIRSSSKTFKGMYEKNTEVSISPVYEKMDKDNIYIATIDAAPIIEAGGCLCFSTSFNDVWAYADDKLIYERIGGRSLLMKSNGNVWHFIRVEDDVDKIYLKSIPKYDSVLLTAPKFIAGDYYNIRSTLIFDSLLAFITSIIDMIFGLGMIVYFFVTRKINPGKARIIYFGIAATLIGIWSAGETNTMVILLSNGALAGVMAFLILIFIPVPYVIYIHTTLWDDDKFIYKIPIYLSLLNFVIVVGLALAGIRDLKQSVFITHIIWGLNIVYVIVAAARVIKNRKTITDRVIVFNAVAMLSLIAVAGVEIVYYWTGLRSQNDFWGRFFVLLYIVLLAYTNIRDSFKDIEKGRMAEYYRELANTDSMTRLFNRTAFNNDVDMLTEDEAYTIISIDLNNLKLLNDSRGHQAGDRYIINAANIIKKIFGNAGNCYRIGGDEFSVIIKGEESDFIAGNLIPKMEHEIIRHNSTYPAEPVSMAWGFESNTKDSKRNYVDILHCADEKMYENKRMQKDLQS